MSLDKIGLEIIERGDNAKAAACARKIKPVRDNGNLLLCTLVVVNVAVNALLSILMAGLFNAVVGFVLSTVVITIFGEIAPQAICSRHGK
jgi:metal transporter CNNM